jgi:hypothetical protein
LRSPSTFLHICNAQKKNKNKKQDRHACEMELLQRDIDAIAESIKYEEESSAIQVEKLELAKSAHVEILNEMELLKGEEAELEEKMNAEEVKHAELLHRYRLETVDIERDIEDRYRKQLHVADQGMMTLCFDALPEGSRQAMITNSALKVCVCVWE